MSNQINNTEVEIIETSVDTTDNNTLVPVVADTNTKNHSEMPNDFIARNDDENKRLSDIGLRAPTEPVELRKDAYLHSNGTALMNACTMFYGGAKTGETRLLTKAFSGSGYIFLDFDRNYESTVANITLKKQEVSLQRVDVATAETNSVKTNNINSAEEIRTTTNLLPTILPQASKKRKYISDWHLGTTESDNRRISI